MKKIYSTLLKEYGCQGWWPVTPRGKTCPEYNPGDYTHPKTDEQKFEICVGAILTQNTSWTQVEKALHNLKKLNKLNADGIKKIKDDVLKKAIKPAGYFNQKAKKLKKFADFYLKLKEKKLLIPTRKSLLEVWGVGPETADSILLYGHGVPVFVIDAYTKRMFSRLGLCDEKIKYEDLQESFHKNLKKDAVVFNEYHALIVEHAKQKCKKKPECDGCVLRKMCKNYPADQSTA